MAESIILFRNHAISGTPDDPPVYVGTDEWSLFMAGSGGVATVTHAAPNGYNVTVLSPVPGQTLNTTIDRYAVLFPMRVRVTVPDTVAASGHFIVSVRFHWQHLNSSSSYSARLTANTGFQLPMFTATPEDSEVTFEYPVTVFDETYDDIRVPGLPGLFLYNFTEGRVIDHYEWDFGDGTTMTTVEHPVTHEYDEEGTYMVRSRVFDQFGLPINDPSDNSFGWSGSPSGWRETQVTATGGHQLHALSDRDGVGYVALRTDAGVDIYEYKDGQSTKRVISTITGHTPNGLYQHPGDGLLHLVVREKTTNEIHLFSSDDGGENWENMATLPLSGGDYKGHRAHALSDGGHGCIAIRKQTDPVEVVFVRSPDGVNWSTPAPVATLADVNGCEFSEESASGSARLVAVLSRRGDEPVLYHSDDTGETWDTDEEEA